MKRWNSWGEEELTYPLPASAAVYLEAIVGKGLPSQDITKENVLVKVAPGTAWFTTPTRRDSLPGFLPPRRTGRVRME